jgi:hypothetical protein
LAPRIRWEHWQFDFVDDLDAQPVRGHVDGELFGQLRKCWVGADSLLDLIGRSLEGRFFLTVFFGGDLGLGNRSWLGRLALALNHRCTAGPGGRARLFLPAGLFVSLIGVLVVSQWAFAYALTGDGAMRSSVNTGSSPSWVRSTTGSLPVVICTAPRSDTSAP